MVPSRFHLLYKCGVKLGDIVVVINLVPGNRGRLPIWTRPGRTIKSALIRMNSAIDEAEDLFSD